MRPKNYLLKILLGSLKGVSIGISQYRCQLYILH